MSSPYLDWKPTPPIGKARIATDDGPLQQAKEFTKLVVEPDGVYVINSNTMTRYKLPPGTVFEVEIL